MNLKNQRKTYRLSLGEHELVLGRRTAVMGILNITPDSFSRDGLLNAKNVPQQAVRLARRMVKAGTDIIDVGGESSRPGAEKVTRQDELKRVIPVVKALAQSIDVPISIDTYKADVAKAALDEGATIVNNIKGCQLSKALVKHVVDYDASLVLMHMQGKPNTMQQRVHYKNVIEDIYTELDASIRYCLDLGLKRDKIMVDPGIGFGKSVDHNLLIMKHLSQFQRLKCPVLLGASRKSFIGHVLDCDVNQRLSGSLAAAAAAVTAGAHIVRVHDVKETRHVVDMIDAIIHAEKER